MPAVAVQSTSCPASFHLHMRRYCLYTLNSALSSRLLQKVGQLQQIVIAEQTPAGGQHNKWICGQQGRPARWNRAQNAVAVVKVNSILTPVMAIGDQLEPLALQRMMWMDDLEESVGTVAMRCS